MKIEFPQYANVLHRASAWFLPISDLTCEILQQRFSWLPMQTLRGTPQKKKTKKENAKEIISCQGRGGVGVFSSLFYNVMEVCNQEFYVMLSDLTRKQQ